MHKLNSFCSYCGQAFAENQPWPRTCAGCANITFRNPLPVALVLLPVDDGVLCVRRDIEPFRGQLALPGGFMEMYETFQQAAARELFEEAQIVIDPAEITELRVLSPPPPDTVVLIFGLARPRTSASLPPFVPNNETSERVVVTAPQELAFPLATQVLREYFERRK
jgi:ADP-ribose pyrophosphatase YjhB (NUDIX family)